MTLQQRIEKQKQIIGQMEQSGITDLAVAYSQGVLAGLQIAEAIQITQA